MQGPGKTSQDIISAGRVFKVPSGEVSRAHMNLGVLDLFLSPSETKGVQGVNSDLQLDSAYLLAKLNRGAHPLESR